MPVANLDVVLNVTGKLTKSVGDIAGEGNITIKRAHAFTEGSGANQAQAVYNAKLTAVDTVGTTLDLAGGGLTDIFGDALTFTKIKAIVVDASGSNTANVVVGGATNAVNIFGAAAHTLSVGPGGSMRLTYPDANGVAVAAGSSDEFKVAAASGTVDVDVTIIGTTS